MTVFRPWTSFSPCSIRRSLRRTDLQRLASSLRPKSWLRLKRQEELKLRQPEELRQQGELRRQGELRLRLQEQPKLRRRLQKQPAPKPLPGQDRRPEPRGLVQLERLEQVLREPELQDLPELGSPEPRPEPVRHPRPELEQPPLPGHPEATLPTTRNSIMAPLLPPARPAMDANPVTPAKAARLRGAAVTRPQLQPRLRNASPRNRQGSSRLVNQY